MPEVLRNFYTRQKLMRSFSLIQGTKFSFNAPLLRNGKHAACNHRVMTGLTREVAKYKKSVKRFYAIPSLHGNIFSFQFQSTIILGVTKG